MNTSDLYPGTLWGSAPQSWFFRNSSAASRMRSIVVFTQGGEWRFMHSVGCVTVLCGTKRAIWEAFPLAFERVIKLYIHAMKLCKRLRVCNLTAANCMRSIILMTLGSVSGKL